jgi:hypothetical protein
MIFYKILLFLNIKTLFKYIIILDKMPLLNKAVIQSLEQSFKDEVIVIAEKIASKFDLELVDVVDYVESLLNSSEEKPTTTKKPEKKKIQVDEEVEEKKEEPKKEIKKKTENPHEGKTCQHKMTSGKKKGELCGDKVHSESKTGIYCKTHLKNESGNKFLQSTLSTSGEVEKTEKKEEKKPVKKDIKKKEDSPLINDSAKIKEVIEQRTNQLTIKKNKQWNHYEHPETGLVVDPVTKEVIGRLNHETGIVSELTPEDIELAKTIGLKKIRIPENLPTKKIEKNNLYNDSDDEEDISDVEDDEDDELDE